MISGGKITGKNLVGNRGCFGCFTFCHRQNDQLRWTERDCLDDIFTWQEQRRVTAQLTVHHKRTMYILQPTEEAKAAAKKRVTVVEYEDGRVTDPGQC